MSDLKELKAGKHFSGANVDVELTAKEYFDIVKENKKKITDAELLNIYDNAELLLKKAMITNQISAAKKLYFHLETLEKERELVKMGIDTFVYKDDIEEFIDNVAKNTVKIIELERYEREIPDEIVEVVAKTSHLFDRLYVVFTDYTGKVEKQAIKERQKEKDPILFGTFQSEKNRVVIDRFYFLGDWIDEYCDLTLDKMVSEMKSSADKDIINRISTPKSLEEIKKQLDSLEIRGSRIIVNNKRDVKPSFISKIKTIFTK